MRFSVNMSAKVCSFSCNGESQSSETRVSSEVRRVSAANLGTDKQGSQSVKTNRLITGLQNEPDRSAIPEGTE